MTTFVVDASVVIKWFIPEVGSDAAKQLLAGDHVYAAPDLLFLELASVIRKKVRRGDLSEPRASRLVDELSTIAVGAVSHRELVRDAYELATATGQTVYDSMYLVLALRLDTVMITADERYVRAIRAIPELAPHVRAVGEITAAPR